MPPADGRLVLVRHGATLDNIAGRLMGGNDAPLTEEAVAGALELGTSEQMRTLLAEAPTVISSPLCRAMQTAEWIAAGTGLRVEVDTAFRERSFGCYEGRLLKELADEPRWHAFEAGFADRPPGGESLADVEARVFPRLQALHVQTAPEDNVIIVGHSTVWRLVAQALHGRRAYPLVEPIAPPLSVQVFDRALIEELCTLADPDDCKQTL